MEHQDGSVDTIGKGFFMGGHQDVCISMIEGGRAMNEPIESVRLEG